MVPLTGLLQFPLFLYHMSQEACKTAWLGNMETKWGKGVGRWGCLTPKAAAAQARLDLSSGHTSPTGQQRVPAK